MKKHHVRAPSAQPLANPVLPALPEKPVVQKPVARTSLRDRMRGFFFKPERAAAPKAAATPSTASKAVTVNAATTKPVEVKIAPRKKKKGPRKLQRKSLQEYLNKAGYEMDADRLKKRLFYTLIVIFLAATIVILFFASDYGANALDTLLFILGLWTAVFAAAALLLMAGVYFFLDYRIFARTREVEEVLPDFLQLASSNIAAGMPIDRALWYAIRPSFGVLAKEMEEVAKATMAGEDLEKSLTHFTDKYDSTTLKRSITILIEGLRAGGEMADLLNKIALNIEELKIMKKEMAANVTTYAIFIAFAASAIAPFLFALATELLSIIIKITGTLDLSSSNSPFSFGSPDPSVIGNFKIFSVCMLVMSSMFSASIVSVIKRGNVLEGIKTIPLYAVVAVTIYFLALSLLSVMFSGIVG